MTQIDAICRCLCILITQVFITFWRHLYLLAENTRTAEWNVQGIC